MRPTFVTLLLACLFVLVPPSQAQWIQTNFAFDGFLRCLTTSGTTLWAGTDSGVYRSTNSGTDWTIVNNGLSNTNITSLGSVGGTLFAATSGGPTFRSTNNGEV